MLTPASAACPEFVTVNVCSVDVEFTSVLPKVICVGLSKIPPTATPVPSSGTVNAATPWLLTVAVNTPG